MKQYNVHAQKKTTKKNNKTQKQKYTPPKKLQKHNENYNLHTEIQKETLGLKTNVKSNCPNVPVQCQHSVL